MEYREELMRGKEVIIEINRHGGGRTDSCVSSTSLLSDNIALIKKSG